MDNLKGLLNWLPKWTTKWTTQKRREILKKEKFFSQAKCREEITLSMLTPKVLGLGGIDSAVFIDCLGIARVENLTWQQRLWQKQVTKGENWILTKCRQYEIWLWLPWNCGILGLPTLFPCLAVEYNFRGNMWFPSTTAIFYRKGFRTQDTINF